MKKEDFYDLAAELEKQCGDWENSEGLSESARARLLERAAQLEGAQPEKEPVRHFHMKKRYVLVLAAVLVLLMGIGAVGDRAWISDKNDMERASEMTTKIDNEEKEIYQEISEKLGIAEIRLGYYPEGMVLDSYAIAENTGWAYVNYKYEDKIVTIQMAKENAEVSGNVQWDGNYKKLEDVPNEYGYEIDAYCIDEEHHNYGAEILYGNGYYNILGSFSDKNEFFLILNHFFFKNV